MNQLIEEKPINRVKISWETLYLSSNQLEAINDILQLLFFDAGLNNAESILAVLNMMTFHKIDIFILECEAFSYYLKLPNGE